MIAAPASGSGKTTVACGLMAALRAAGLAVSGHKIGPDYIDPGYHALATGRPARNLDPFLCGADRIVPLFAHGARGADVAVVEGVMGLFDGTDPGTGGRRRGSGLRLDGARRPAARRAGRAGHRRRRRWAARLAAVAAGFARFDPRTTVAGVILNRVASDRHERLLRGGLAAAGIAVYGAIRRSAEVAAPSRHLGLVPAAERSAAATDAMARLAALIKESCDLPGLLALARSAAPLPGPAWDARRSPPRSAALGNHKVPPAVTSSPGRPGTEPVPVVAIAGGAAFTFSYTEHAELLAAAGLDVAASTRCATSTCPAARPGSSWAAASRRSTPPTCPPTNRCAGTWPRPPRGACPSPPNARACSTWRGPWTASPCAGSSRSRRP